ncbi:cytochrome oxidase assembly [Hydrogenobacter thermophilus TK-6]|uniref:Heme O oxygenase n=1 Tax=Hydrogenobacter thermophilus (strain DSM 6534 / IAM 12695 / TK-6) TaxID=608538 RepID=D3DH54_HYDTT|nr:COX15/CtaA family protein [Hydrogenobacter thermophilus]ADO45093.1 cytochrome oxidase assembly [Hydrogenobacter thermophilus TK-6]BAI69156.1 heme O oxygenase [Hydrogenobacter thermophilus TK-6]
MLRAFLILAIVFTYVAMVWGGLVRSSDSGLACPSWPLCYGSFEPPKDTAAKLEMGHRTVSSLAGIFTLLSFVYVWKKTRGLPKLTSTIALAFTFSAALTGMKMIKAETPHLKYLSHMLLESVHIYESMIILGFLILTYRLIYKRSMEEGVPLYAYIFALITMITGVLVRYTGSGEACGHEWPTCNGSLIPDFTSWKVTLQFLHRNLAYTTWLAFLLALVSSFNRTTLLSFVFVNLQFVFAISMVLTGFFLPLSFMDTAMGFFFFAWLTYNVQIKPTINLKVKEVW